MRVLDESDPVCVFLVNFVVDGREWAVRIKQHLIDAESRRLDVVQAISAVDPLTGESTLLTGDEWQNLIYEHRVVEEFWSHALHRFLTLAGGGEPVKA
jgi:hypothetical protein